VKALKIVGFTAALASALVVSGCGEVARTGRAPAQIVIIALEGAPGNEPDNFGGTLLSDVVTIVQRQSGGQTVDTPTIFNDLGRVTMRLVLKDPGIPGSLSSPTALNTITVNRYRVTYRRADGRNTPGVDVPYPFDSAVTFTIPAEAEASAGFELVHHTAKMEAPLAALGFQSTIISTIAEVTFYGRDQAGNEVMATGNIGVLFGNFADPE
jgi:hypothetical protein